MRVLLLLPILMGVAVKAAPPSVQPTLDVLPGVEIIDTGSPVPAGSDGSSPHQQQVRPQIQPPRPIDRHAASKPGPAILPAVGAQPIPDDALPELIRDDRAADAQSDNVQGRFLPGIVVAIGRPSGRPLLEVTKTGTCPLSPPIPSILLSCRLQECEQDDDCYGPRKCCRYHCSSICADPDPSVSFFGQNWDNSAIEFEGNNYNNYNNYEKPGSCYRPGWGNSNYYGGNGGNNYYGRRKRQVAYSNQPLPATPKGGFGGQHGGNGGGFGNGGSWNDRCNRDRDCPGNKKCCSYRCQTPAVIG